MSTVTQDRPVDQAVPDTQVPPVDGSPSPLPASAEPSPTEVPPVGDPSPTPANEGASPRACPLVSDPLTLPANALTTPKAVPLAGSTHPPSATNAVTPQGQTSAVAEGFSPVSPPTAEVGPPRGHVPIAAGGDTDGWLTLRIWAEMFHDAQQSRIASVNRAERGGVDPAIYDAYIEALETAEKVVKRSMLLAYRRTVPALIRQWVTDTPGLGDHTMARLLGHLGHPRIATPHHWEGTGTDRVLVADPPYERTVSQLWQYCGHGKPGRMRKGMSAVELAQLGNPGLKMLVHLLAEATMKQKANPGPHRLLYDQLREDYADKVHTSPCVRCGPSGKPAEVGSPWSPGHQMAGALRVVGKRLLADLWEVAEL